MSSQHSNGKNRKEPKNAQGKQQGFATLAVHAGMIDLNDGTRPTNVPIYATTTFLSEDAEALDGVLGGTRPGYVYGRYANPTIAALEATVTALEGAAGTVAVRSGSGGPPRPPPP